MGKKQLASIPENLKESNKSNSDIQASSKNEELKQSFGKMSFGDKNSKSNMDPSQSKNQFEFFNSGFNFENIHKAESKVIWNPENSKKSQIPSKKENIFASKNEKVESRNFRSEKPENFSQFGPSKSTQQARILEGSIMTTSQRAENNVPIDSQVSFKSLWQKDKRSISPSPGSQMLPRKAERPSSLMESFEDLSNLLFLKRNRSM